MDLVSKDREQTQQSLLFISQNALRENKELVRWTKRFSRSKKEEVQRHLRF